MDHRVCVAHYYLIRGGKIKDLANIYFCTLLKSENLYHQLTSVLLLKQFLASTDCE